MTIFTLMTYIGIVALIFTLLIVFVLKKHKSVVMTYFQSFTGILFIFSGWVKAVDPMGTAFKMDDYFAEFNVAFSDSIFSFLAPIFPFLANYSLAFAIFMIIFEIILGVMLLFGDRPKLTSWLFFLLVLFFTALTGYTYLTGYVPLESTFFKFGTWGEYKATNMRVTDCGCFGDFIKLDPKISFYKDVFLLIPAVYFLFRWDDMHVLISKRSRNLILAASTIFLILYCIYNFHWNEPHVDFRPFKNGTNIAAVQKIEKDAANAVQVLALKMKNKKTGDLKEFKYADYMKNLSTITEEWETVEQIKTEPTIQETKISHFDITDFEGNERSELYLANEKAHIMVPIFKAKYTAIPNKRIVKDTVFVQDTIPAKTSQDSMQIVEKVQSVTDREETYYDIIWDADFIKVLKEVIKPLHDAAKKDNVEMSVVISGIDSPKAELLKIETGLDVEYLTADEKLLKTIMRSNPGIILWKNGVLLHKWHYKKLPSWDVIKAEFLTK